MLQYLHTETDKEKRRHAANNLIVLSRERAGADLLVNKPQVLEKMIKLLKDSTLDPEIRLTIIRTFGELLKGDPVRVSNQSINGVQIKIVPTGKNWRNFQRSNIFDIKYSCS